MMFSTKWLVIATLLALLAFAVIGLWPSSEKEPTFQQTTEESADVESWEEVRQVSSEDAPLLGKLEKIVIDLPWSTTTQEYPYDSYTAYSGEIKFELRRWHGASCTEDSITLSVYMFESRYGAFYDIALLFELPEYHTLTQAAVLSYHIHLDKQHYLETKKDSIEAARREQAIRGLRDRALEKL